MSDYLENIDWTNIGMNTVKAVFAGILIAISAYYGVQLSLSELSNRIDSVEHKVNTNATINSLEINALQKEAREQNERLHNLNERIQEQINQDSKLIKEFDNRYVRIELFNAHKDNVSTQLTEIKHTLQALLKYRIENKE